jgi:hypothetical protein
MEITVKIDLANQLRDQVASLRLFHATTVSRSSQKAALLRSSSIV